MNAKAKQAVAFAFMLAWGVTTISKGTNLAVVAEIEQYLLDEALKRFFYKSK